jgi:hypothetical protein
VRGFFQNDDLLGVDGIAARAYIVSLKRDWTEIERYQRDELRRAV